MHEASLTEGILRLVDEQAAALGFAAVRTIRLEIGGLSTVDPEALRFCFEAMREGTIAAGAVLDIINVPGEAFCVDCVKPVPIQNRYDCCPDCGGGRLDVIGGTEMRVKELEVE